MPGAVRDGNKGDQEDVGKCHWERVTMAREEVGRKGREGRRTPGRGNST